VKLGEEDLVVSMLIFASFLAYAPEPISTLHPDAGGREPCCRSACAWGPRRRARVVRPSPSGAAGTPRRGCPARCWTPVSGGSG